MTNIRNALMQAAGSASGDPVYVEDVFSTHLFTGTQSTLAINNGIDLDDKGGLVWFKARNNARNHALFDTERGNNLLYSSTSAAQSATTTAVTATNSNGFTVGSDTQVNKSGETIVAWTFAKQEGFFDIVKFSTTGGGGTQAVSHSLGSIPGMIIIKKTSGSENWFCWHKGITDSHSNWWRNYGFLDTNGAFNDFGSDTGIASAPSSTAVTFGSYFTNNTSDYVMYVFAEGGSDDQKFGDDGDEAIIKTGAFQSSGSGSDVNLGFEPQWVLVKPTSSASSWHLFDTMRGMPADTSSKDAQLFPDTSGTENTSYANQINPNATGFHATHSWWGTLKCLYVAIRRGPMKEPSAGTDVYIQDESHPSSYESPFFQTPWPVDFGLYRKRTASPDEGNYASTRITGTNYLVAQNNSAGNPDNAQVWDFMNGYYDLGSGAYADYSSIMFRRYPKVFDVSVVKSTTSSAANYSHNLGVAPEFFISKRLDGAGGWVLDQVDYYLLMSNSADLGSEYVLFENLTATTYGAKSGTFSSGETHLVLMFASLDGISKVGTYTGTGNDLNVTGLNAAARFVLIKRTDSSGDWYVFDSTVQGIVSGNDPYWILSSNAADVTNTDYIDPHSSGFTITSSAPADLNASGGTYRYLAIS